MNSAVVSSKRARVYAVTLLSSAFFILCWRAVDPFRWSEWRFGDAQTMLAVRNWQESGFRALHFLWVPQGYAHVTKNLDRPDLSHHAHGIEHVSGPKRAYTHFPSWYAVPYGILGKAGVYQKSLFQAIALALSFGGLFFLFLFFQQTLGDRWAVGVVTVSVLQGDFLSYCDSLATMPFDDFFRALFLFLWLRHLRSGTGFLGCWAVYFLSSLCSLDSMGFIAASALGLSYLEKKFAWRELAILAAAPVVALFVQLTQNIAYLGWDSAIQDWTWQFTRLKHIDLRYPNSSWINRVAASLESLLRRATSLTLTDLAIVVPFAAYLGRRVHRDFNRYLLFFFVAALPMVLVFPEKMRFMPYESKLVQWFAALLWTGFIFGVFELIAGLGSKPAWRSAWRGWGAAALVFSVLFYHGFARMAAGGITAFDHPLDASSRRIFEFLERVGKRFPEEKIVFSVKPYTLPTLDDSRVRAHQVDPVTEYLLNGPVFGVDSLDGFYRDYQILRTLEERRLVYLLVAKTAELPQVDVFLRSHGLDRTDALQLDDPRYAVTVFRLRTE